MRHLSTLLILAALCASCATKPARQPVEPQPDLPLQSGECAALYSPEFQLPVWHGPGPRPAYGWALVKIDVENGVVTRAELVAASPKGLVEEASLAYAKLLYYPSKRSAKGCVIRHHWD